MQQGSHRFVYFVLSDEHTLSGGLVYSEDGRGFAPGDPADNVEHIDGSWFYTGSFNNGPLESLY